MATRRRSDDDFRAEIDAHLAQESEALEADGLSPEAARTAARKAFGNRTIAEERYYESGRRIWLEHTLLDLRFAARVLRKDLRFSLLAVAGLGLGIGISTAVFALINESIRINTESVGNPKSFVSINRLESGRWSNSFSYDDYRYYTDRASSFRAVKAESGRYPCVLAAGSHHEPEATEARFVSANFLSATELRPVLGRVFTAEEEHGDGPMPALLSAWYWRMHFGADTGILGRVVTINAHRATIVGVADPRFEAGDKSGLFLPLGSQPAMVSRGNWLRGSSEQWLMLDAVLHPAISVQKAQAEMVVLADSRRRTTSANPVEGSIVLTPGGGSPHKRRMLLTLAISVTLGVAMILMIASSNLANLLLARAVVRRREIAVRLSLGATRARLVRQLLTESLLLALCGGLLGVLFSHWLAQAVFLEFGAANGYQMRLDPVVLLYSLGLSVATGLSFGLAPALSATKASLSQAFHADGLEPGRSQANPVFALRNGLVIVPMALSLMLLLGAGMAVRSIQSTYLKGPAFDTTRLVAVGSPLHLEGYDEARTRDFQSRLRDRIASMPGVQSVALATALPLMNSSGSLPLESGNTTDYNVISPEFFQTVGVSPIRGRPFTALDREASQPVVLVNQEFARRNWPNEEAIGKEVRLRGATTSFQVVGLAPDMEDPNGPFNAVRPTVYVPEAQGNLFLMGRHLDIPSYQLQVLMRTKGDPSAVKAAVRQEALALDSSLRVELTTEAESRESVFGQIRAVCLILSALGALALIMASLGIYAILAYAVSQRTREIGIRMALGAQRREVLSLVMQRAAAMIAWGIALGLAGAMALSRVLASTLNDLGTLDLPTCIAASGVLGAVALLASYLPARKALRVNPVTALRWE